MVKKKIIKKGVKKKIARKPTKTKTMRKTKTNLVNRRLLNRGEYHAKLKKHGFSESACKRLRTIEALEQTLDQAELEEDLKKGKIKKWKKKK